MIERIHNGSGGADFVEHSVDEKGCLYSIVAGGGNVR